MLEPEGFQFFPEHEVNVLKQEYVNALHGTIFKQNVTVADGKH